MTNKRDAETRLAASVAVVRACFGRDADGLTRPTRGPAGEALLRQLLMHIAASGDDEGGRAGMGAVARAMKRDRSTVTHGAQVIEDLRGDDDDIDAIVAELMCGARAIEAVRAVRAQSRSEPSRDVLIGILREAGKRLLDRVEPEREPEVPTSSEVELLMRALGLSRDVSVDHCERGATLRFPLPAAAAMARKAIEDARKAFASAGFRILFSEALPTRTAGGALSGHAGVMRVQSTQPRPATIMRL